MFPDLIGELERELLASAMGKKKTKKTTSSGVYDIRISPEENEHDGTYDIDITFTNNIVDTCTIMGSDNPESEPLVYIKRKACDNDVTLTESLILEVADSIRAHRSKRK